MGGKLRLVLVGTVCALLAVGTLLPLFINANNFKETVVRQLQATTGYRVALEGGISLRMLPFARLRAEKLSVYSPLPGNDKPFAQLSVLDIGVKFFPLLQGRVEITGIAVKNAVFQLIRNKNSGNWWGKSGSRDANGAKWGTGPMSGIELTDATLTYEDTEGGARIELSSLSLKTGKRWFSSSVDMQAKASWNGKPVVFKAQLTPGGWSQADRRTPTVFSFESEPLKVKGKGVVDSQMYMGEIEAKTASLAGASRWLTGRQRAGGGLPLAFDIKGTGSCVPARCSMLDASMHVNNMAFRGSASYDILGGPTVAADLKAATLDITPYIPTVPASQAAAGESRWSNAPIDFSALHAVEGNIVVNAEHVVAGKFTANKVLFQAKMGSGAFSSDVGFGELYQGKGNGSLTIGADNRVEGLVVLDNVEAQPLLSVVAMNNRFSGKLTTRISFKSQGTNLQALVANASGNGQAHLSDGKIAGVDIAGMVNNVASAFTASNALQGETGFSHFGGGFTMAGGIIANDDLSVDMPLLRVNGAGKVDLPAYRLDYRLSGQVPDAPGAKKQNKQVGVPVLVSGPLDSPVYAAELSGAARTPKKPKDL